MAEKNSKTGSSDLDCSGTVGVNRDDESVRGTSDSLPCSRAGFLTCGDEEWLQLGIGRSCRTSPMENGTHSKERREGLLDLNLFTNKPYGSLSISKPQITQPNSLCVTSSAAGTVPSTNLTCGISISPSREPPTIPFVKHQQKQKQKLYNATGGSGNNLDLDETAEGVRMVLPPPRSQNGLWFMLEASQNQDVRRPFLQQLTPKRYFRIKDKGMKVCMLMKYLASKLGLDSELEVAITCRGQVVYPHLTLQHVRDNLWCKRDIVALLPDSTIDNVMTLQYGRSTFTISSYQTKMDNPRGG